MKLTDNEIRDINRYLKEGKPLLEKYRFLLFEDKREEKVEKGGSAFDPFFLCAKSGLKYGRRSV